MKLLLLPPKPLLTKKGTVRKRGRGVSPGRVFLEDGSELTGVAMIGLETDEIGEFTVDGPAKPPKYRISVLHLELRDPQVEIIDQVPAQARKGGAA